jgi:hypothetical protein
VTSSACAATASGPRRGGQVLRACKIRCGETPSLYEQSSPLLTAPITCDAAVLEFDQCRRQAGRRIRPGAVEREPRSSASRDRPVRDRVRELPSAPDRREGWALSVPVRAAWA